jgi:hypothetical protein
MDFKTYMKDTYKNVGSFDRAFKPWVKWQNIKLSDICPCNTCEVSKELRKRQYEVQMSGGLQEEITKTCEHCIDNVLWRTECLEKLAWYENKDERLKEN